MNDHDPSGGSGPRQGRAPTLPSATPKLPTSPPPNESAATPQTTTRDGTPSPSQTLVDPIRTTRAELDRRARRRAVITSVVMVLFLGGAGALALFAYGRSRADQTAVTEPTTFVEDYPSVRGGPRADDQMAEIDRAIDDAHGGEFLAPGETTAPNGPPGAVSVTNLVMLYESAAPDAEWQGVFTEYDLDGDHLAVWGRGTWYDFVATEDWVYRQVDSSTIERHRRTSASRAPGADVPLAGVVTPGTLIPDDVFPFASLRSDPANPVQIYAIDLAAFESSNPDAADRWLTMWTASDRPQLLADPSGPVQTADLAMSQIRSSTALLAAGPHKVPDLVEPLDADTFVAFQTGPDGTVVTARMVSYEHDLRVDFVVRDRVRGGFVPEVPDDGWR